MIKEKTFFLFADLIKLNYFHNAAHVLHLAFEHLQFFSFFILHSLQFRGIERQDQIPQHTKIHDYFFGPLSSSEPTLSTSSL